MTGSADDVVTICVTIVTMSRPDSDTGICNIVKACLEHQFHIESLALYVHMLYVQFFFMCKRKRFSFKIKMCFFTIMRGPELQRWVVSRKSSERWSRAQTLRTPPAASAQAPQQLRSTLSSESCCSASLAWVSRRPQFRDGGQTGKLSSKQS